MISIPAPIKKSLVEIFGFGEKRLFPQMATVSGSRPMLRTMWICDVNSKGELLTMSHTKCQKWRDLETNPEASLCFFDHESGTQILCAGKVNLVTKKNNRGELDTCWGMISDRKKMLYGGSTPGSDQNKAKAPSVPKEIPDTFGVIILEPRFWEMLSRTKKTDKEKTRIQFKKKGDKWEKKRVVKS